MKNDYVLFNVFKEDWCSGYSETIPYSNEFLNAVNKDEYEIVNVAKKYSKFAYIDAYKTVKINKEFEEDGVTYVATNTKRVKVTQKEAKELLLQKFKKDNWNMKYVIESVDEINDKFHFKISYNKNELLIKMNLQTFLKYLIEFSGEILDKVYLEDDNYYLEIRVD